MKKYYVYELIDSRNNKVFYVGKGCHKRMYTHYNIIKNGHNLKNGHLGNKLKQLIKENLKPIYRKVFITNDEQEAYNKEIETIDKIGKENLCNLTDGGEGGFSSIEHQQKATFNSHISLRNRLKTDEKFRKYFGKMSSERMACLHIEGKVKPYDWTGRKHKSETIEKMKKTFKARKHQSGENNSQFGTQWIFNLKTKKNKKILKTAPIPKSWTKGRKLVFY